MKGASPAWHASAGVSVWNLLAIGALALLVVLLAAERAAVGGTWGAAVLGDRREDGVREVRRAAAGGGTAAARADRTRRASELQMIHVGKAGGGTARLYLGYPEQYHLKRVNRYKVRPPRPREEYPTASRPRRR